MRGVLPWAVLRLSCFVFGSSPTSLSSLTTLLMKGDRCWDIPAAIAPTGAETTCSRTQHRAEFTPVGAGEGRL